MQFVRFPNGKVWRTDAHGVIEGSVLIDQEGETEKLESFLDAIAEAATGSAAGLEGFSYRSHGGGWVSFCGTAAEYLMDLRGEEEESEFRVLEADSPELARALAQQYELSEQEVRHALGGLDKRYGQECSLAVVGSPRSLCCPAHPQECTYVRTVIDGLEIGFWDAKGWQGDSSNLMGAVISSLLNEDSGKASVNGAQA